MDNALMLGAMVAVLGMLLAIVMNIVGNRQDREARRRAAPSTRTGNLP